MTTRKTDILGFLALFAILAAIWVLFGESSNEQADDRRGEAVFTRLASQANDVDSIKVVEGDVTLTLAREGEAWFVREKGDFPADTGKIRSWLRSLVSAQRLEARTGDPALLPKIGLGETAPQVTLSAAGSPVAAFRSGNGKGEGRYILVDGEPSSWLVDGIGEAGTNLDRWIDNRMLPFRGGDISAMTLTDGATLSRPTPDAVFAASNGAAVETWASENLAGSLGQLSIIDVQKMANPLSEPVGILKLTSFSGVVIALKLFQDDAGVWAQGTAAFDADAAVSGSDSETDPSELADRLASRYQGWLFLLDTSRGATPLIGASDLAQKSDTASR